MPWSRPFDKPIQPPKGNAIATLKDAAAYILKLPKSKQQSPEWQAAVEAVMMAAEDRGPLMHALPLSMSKAIVVRRPDVCSPDPSSKADIGPDLFRKACEFDLEGLVESIEVQSSKFLSVSFDSNRCQASSNPSLAFSKLAAVPIL